MGWGPMCVLFAEPRSGRPAMLFQECDSPNRTWDSQSVQSFGRQSFIQNTPFAIPCTLEKVSDIDQPLSRNCCPTPMLLLHSGHVLNRCLQTCHPSNCSFSQLCLFWLLPPPLPVYTYRYSALLNVISLVVGLPSSAQPALFCPVPTRR